MLYSVIMAGGTGTRFWPLSRRKNPKQVISLAEGPSLFERTVARLKRLVPPERTYVVTRAELAPTLRALAPQLPRENVIGEPVGRDSAAAVFLGASIIAHKDGQAVILVSAADHLIAPAARFRAAVRKASGLARHGFLVTFGIPPTRPSTAYGYVECGAALPGVAGAFRVRRFHEKPSSRTARRYLRAKRFFWNSGLFVWKAATILDAARRFAPEHFAAISPLGALHGAAGFQASLAAAYRKVNRISIDYAIMEKARNVAMLKADFDWADVGGPLALRRCMKADGAGNIHIGLVDLLDSRDCVAVSGDDRLLALFGCEDLVVIQTPDATLVCPADRAEELKKLVSRLDARSDTAEFL